MLQGKRILLIIGGGIAAFKSLELIRLIRKAGGEVMDMIIPLPMGRFAYAHDPDGNSIGLFEYTKG